MSSTPRRILLLPGDGVGPEVIGEVRRLLDWLSSFRGLNVDVEEAPFGGAAYDQSGSPLDDATLERAQDARCVIMGAVGSPRYADVPYHQRPEAGLLRLRSELQLFANLRPVITFDALVNASTLKPEVVRGIDILFVRELTGGVYFGEPRGVSDNPEGGRTGVNTHRYTSDEIRRVAMVAFEHARMRAGRVVSVDKSNVMESGLLWREEVQALRDTNYADIALDHMLADSCAMQLVRAPRQFDVILTDNLFGDILSDEAAMLTGSLGMLPSACVGRSAEGEIAVYEPIHGSAPDIAGKGVANPSGAILSLVMALRLSFKREDLADEIEGALRAILAAGVRTGDIVEPGLSPVSTSAFTDRLLAQLDEATTSV